MSLTGALGAASTIKNLDKVVLYIIGFLGFIVLLISLGVAGLNSSISWFIGLFVMAFAGYAMITGKFSWKIGLPVMLIGGAVTVINPSSKLAIGEVPVIGKVVRELTQVTIRTVVMMI